MARKICPATRSAASGSCSPALRSVTPAPSRKAAHNAAVFPASAEPEAAAAGAEGRAAGCGWAGLDRIGLHGRCGVLRRWRRFVERIGCPDCSAKACSPLDGRRYGRRRCRGRRGCRGRCRYSDRRLAQQVVEREIIRRDGASACPGKALGRQIIQGLVRTGSLLRSLHLRLRRRGWLPRGWQRLDGCGRSDRRVAQKIVEREIVNPPGIAACIPPGRWRLCRRGGRTRFRLRWGAIGRGVAQKRVEVEVGHVDRLYHLGRGESLDGRRYVVALHLAGPAFGRHNPLEEVVLVVVVGMGVGFVGRVERVEGALRPRRAHHRMLKPLRGRRAERVEQRVSPEWPLFGREFTRRDAGGRGKARQNPDHRDRRRRPPAVRSR